MKERKIKAVIFDLDGTLIDSVCDIADAANAALRQHGHPLHTYDEYRTFIGKGLRNLCERSLPESFRTNEEIEACHAILMAHYLEHPVDKTQPYPGIREVLASLHGKGYPMAVLSNKADILTCKIIKELGLMPFFTVVSGLRDGFPRKPDPQGAFWVLEQLNKACTDLNILPENILYCGDSAVDMQTAEAAGFTSCACTWGFRPRAELEACHPHYMVNTPCEILTTGKGDGPYFPPF